MFFFFMVKLLSFLQLQNCRLLMDYTTGISRMVPKTGELHRYALVNELCAVNGNQQYLQKRPELSSWGAERATPFGLARPPNICLSVMYQQSAI
jgi:hypothetical protein